MKTLLLLSLLYGFQCIMIGVLILSGDVYEKKREVFRDLIPFYWFWYVIIKFIKLMIEEWKKLK